jgi:hypothetical protein
VGDEVAVTAGDLTLWILKSHCAPEGGEPEPGGGARVFLPAASRTISPGFLVVRGAQAPTTAPDEALVRVYWNLRPQGRGMFLERVTQDLDAAGVGHVVPGKRGHLVQYLVRHMRTGGGHWQLPLRG